LAGIFPRRGAIRIVRSAGYVLDDRFARMN
jgi:hypothetical protein